MYSRKRWCKKKIEPIGPKRHLNAALDQQGELTHQDNNKDDNSKINDQQQGDHYNASDQPIQENNYSKEAKRLWQMPIELGVTCWDEERSKVQQLVQMEERNITKSERLGGRKRDQ